VIVGVPKEIKQDENRVALVPVGAQSLVDSGHEVLVEAEVGLGSGFLDQEYITAGAEIETDAESVYEKADMIVKVKEPLAQEYELIRENQIVFTYFHYAASHDLTKAMIKSKSVTIAYETVQLPNGELPLLVPMSEVAGRMAVQEGAKYLEKLMGGRGVLLGGVPGVPPAEVLILGGGIVGTNSAKMAAGLGAKVTILDVNLNRLRYLSDVMPKNVFLVHSNKYTIREGLKRADLLIGAVLLPGAKAPMLVSREDLKLMKPGSVLVDVAVDQGGCIETVRPTTHSNPIYEVEGVIHYCVANMPGAVPHTSTLALTNATFPYVKQIADKGWKQACRNDRGLTNGLNIVMGQVTYPGVASAFGLELTGAEALLGN